MTSTPLLFVHGGVLFSHYEKNSDLLQRTQNDIITLFTLYHNTTIYNFQWGVPHQDLAFKNHFGLSSGCIDIPILLYNVVYRIVPPNYRHTPSNFMQAAMVKCLFFDKNIQSVDIAGFYLPGCIGTHVKYLTTSLCVENCHTIEEYNIMLDFLSQKTGFDKDHCKKAIATEIKVSTLQKYCWPSSQSLIS